MALLRASRALIDELHVRLADAGHPGVRPAHGFALQAVGPDGTTSGVLAARLGITKQAGGQMVDELVRLGYVERRLSTDDGRRKLVTLSDRGRDLLRRSAAVLDDLTAEWAARVGDDALRAMQADLLAAVELFGDPGRSGLRPVW